MENKKVLKTTFCGIMAAMSLTLDFLSLGDGFMTKITLYALPLIVVGIMFGMKTGAVTGLVEGTVAQIVKYGFSPMMPFWLAAPVMWGFLPGLIFRLLPYRHIGTYFLAVFVASVTANICNVMASLFDFLLIKDTYYTILNILQAWPVKTVIMLVMIVPYTLLSRILCERLKHVYR